MWFQDEARIGQKNSLTRVWGQTGSRPTAPKDLGFASAYVFGAVCPSDGKAAALIMCFSLNLIRQTLLVSATEPEGGARFSSRAGTATRTLAGRRS